RRSRPDWASRFGAIGKCHPRRHSARFVSGARGAAGPHPAEATAKPSTTWRSISFGLEPIAKRLGELRSDGMQAAFHRSDRNLKCIGTLPEGSTLKVKQFGGFTMDF